MSPTQTGTPAGTRTGTRIGAGPATDRRPPDRGSGRQRWQRIRRRFLRHRRWWAAGLAAAAVFAGIQALRPPVPETTDVLVAARDLPAGRTLRTEDLRRVEYAADTVPDGALPTERTPSGRALAAPVRAGTPLTDRSLVGRALVRSMPRGTVAAPTRIADPELLRLVQVGDRVDVVVAGGAAAPYPAGAAPPAAGDTASTSGHGPARVLAQSALVLAIPSDSSDDGPLTAGNDGLILLAVPPWIAVELAGAGAASPLSLILHGTRS